MSVDNVPFYVATDELLDELRELGYKKSIELDDFIDFLDEDPSYIEQMRPTVLNVDELSFNSYSLSQLLYDRRKMLTERV